MYDDLRELTGTIVWQYFLENHAAMPKRGDRNRAARYLVNEIKPWKLKATERR
jgi:hypothetical protein